MSSSSSLAQEVPFWQTEWQKIKFLDLGVTLDPQNLASAEFYTAFYRQLFARYKSYDDLDLAWRSEKTATAQKLIELVPAQSKVLSYGCGIGFIEKTIVDARPDVSLSAYDFSTLAADWLLKSSKAVRHITKLEEQAQFDVIYLVQVLYALHHDDCVKLFEQLKQHLSPNGKIILVNTSPIDTENRASFAEIESRPLTVKKFLKLLYQKVRSVVPPAKKGQFWGWQRSNQAIRSIVEKSGLAVLDVFSHANQSFIVCKR